MKYAIALFVAMTLNAVANLMMKAGAKGLRESGVMLNQGLGSLMGSVMTHWILLLGLCFFATNVVFYTYALSGPRVQISFAYPIMVGGGFAIIAIVAWKFFGETLTAIQWAGVVLILLGVVMVASQMNGSGVKG